MLSKTVESAVYLPLVLGSLPATPKCFPRPVSTDPTYESEIPKEVEFLERQIEPGSHGLPPGPFGDGANALVRESRFTSLGVCYPTKSSLTGGINCYSYTQGTQSIEPTAGVLAGSPWCQISKIL